MSEHDLQCAVAQLLDLYRFLWAAIPNGGDRNAIVGGKLKAEGVKRGVPDLIIFETCGDQCPECGRGAPGLAIELKFGKGVLSKYQKAWLANLKSRGWLTAVCRSIPEVQRVIESVRRGPPLIVPR